jgi:hypothetical protein
MDGLRMDHGEIGWGGVEWIQLAQWQAVVNVVMNLHTISLRSI